MKTTDFGDGVSMVETHDRGHCYEIVEPDGRVSVMILASSPLASKVAPKPAPDASFHVRNTDSGQEIVDAKGIVVARTSDRAMGEHIRTLLVVWETLKKKQAGSSPVSLPEQK